MLSNTMTPCYVFNQFSRSKDYFFFKSAQAKKSHKWMDIKATVDIIRKKKAITYR